MDASSWVGVPYVKNSFTKQGCDCSGLVLGFALEKYGKDSHMFQNLYETYLCAGNDIKVVQRKIRDEDIMYFMIKNIPHFVIVHDAEKRIGIHSTENCGVTFVKIDAVFKISDRFIGILDV